MKKVGVVIPARDEEETIGLVLDDLNKTISGLRKENRYRFEVMVVVDHRRDKTAKIARKKGAKVIKNLHQSGKGNALRNGFSEVKGDYLVMMDADYSHRPEDLPKFLEALDKGAGLVVGSRIYGGSDEYNKTRAFGNVFLTLVFGIFHGRYLSDALNGYKAFRREVFSDFKYDSKDLEIEIELLANTLRKGLSVVEVSSHERRRAGGKAKSRTFEHGWKLFSRIIEEYFKNRYKTYETRNL